MAIKTVLAANLQTKSVLEGKKGEVHTAYMDPREDMNPGELLAAALGACMLTMVGFMASKRGEDVNGTEVLVDPGFDAKHSRVVSMGLTFVFPATLTEDQKKFYTRAAQTCPVHNSLREDITYTVTVK